MTLRDHELRPDHLKKGQAERYAADVKRLLEHKDEFVEVPCPACGGNHFAKAFEKYKLTYVVCRDCETLHINPRPTPEILDHYYANSENYYYWNTYIFPATENARREKIARPRALRVAEICQRHGVPMEVLLEVGAGFGTFCEEVNSLNLFRRVVAVEPTPDLAETCRRKGLETIAKPIEQITLEKRAINVVASFEVLEHLFSPRNFLQSCAEVLSPGGLLILTCPNAKGFDILVLKELSESVDTEHLNYFHPASLSLLAQDCGLDVLEVLTPGKLDAEMVRKKILSGEFDASGHPFLKHVLVDEWDHAGEAFQEFLQDNGLSSHMWLVARKPGEPGEHRWKS